MRTPRLILICLSLLFCAPTFALQNIILIHSYDQELDWVNDVTRGFLEPLTESQDVRIFIEYMDAKRFPNIQHKEEFYQHILNKYENSDIQAIALSDDPALTIFKEQPNSWLTDLPLIYMGINKVTRDTLELPNSSGVFEFRDLTQTVLDMQVIFNTDDIIIFTDQSETGLANLEIIKEGLSQLNHSIQLHVIKKLSTSNISQTMAQYPQGAPIFVIGQLYDELNNTGLIDFRDGIRILNSAVDSPLITIGVPNWRTGGAFGGHSLSGINHGKEAAQLMLKVLAGMPIKDIPAIRKATSTWYFNWQQMKRFGIAKNDTPPDSIFLFEDVSFYQQHKTLVIGALAISTTALIIIALLIELVRRSKISQRILSENETRYKDLAIQGANIFWETDSGGSISYIYGDTNEMLAIEPNKLIGLSLTSALQINRNIRINLQECIDCFNERLPLQNIIFHSGGADQSTKVLSLNGTIKTSTNIPFEGYRGIIKEITGEYELSEKMAYEASHDPLTGLLNRSSFNNHFRNVLDSNSATKQPTFLCFIDLDSFKIVNDTIGHMAGDGLLTNIAREISNCIESTDTLARLGGDEFGLILTEKDKNQAIQVCQKIIKQITHYRFNWNKQYYSVGVSIGMVRVSSELSYEELLSRADLACYKAKDLGKGQVYFSETNNFEFQSEQIQLGYIANIQQALESNRFNLVRQRIKSLDSNHNTTKYELLLRYTDADGKQIPPNLFIPMAEKYGLITLIDKWVIKKSIELCKTHFHNQDTQISINLSGVSLSNQDFLNEVATIFDNTEIDLSKICIEITETAVVANIDMAISFMNSLKRLGCQFALDDFGSGASSYSYLKNLPIDYLKIDGSLIKQIESEFIDETIVRSINEIAHQKKIKTIAEYVENEGIIAILESIGIDYVQGFAIHRPEEFLK